MSSAHPETSGVAKCKFRVSVHLKLLIASKFVLSGPVQKYLFSFENTKVVFPFFKNSASPRGVFESLLSVQTCPFSFESAEAVSVFDTVTSSFSKTEVPFSRFYTKTRKQRLHA